MSDPKLKLYTLDQKYGEYLHMYDRRVPIISGVKGTRPFIGILFSINQHLFFAPLTSPKTKHLKLKNQIDFLKIKGGSLGAINLNNMLPVVPNLLSRININVCSSDDKNTVQYKNLLKKQIYWCNIPSNRDNIIKKAKKLYHLQSENKLFENINNRCCNFLSLEKALDNYLKKEQNEKYIQISQTQLDALKNKGYSFNDNEIRFSKQKGYILKLKTEQVDAIQKILWNLSNSKGNILK